MRQSLTVPATLISLETITNHVLKEGQRAKLDAEGLFRLRLCVEELVVNTILHGYQKTGQAGSINIHTEITPQHLQVTLEDSAPPFDPRKQAAPDHLHKPAEERDLGGLGIYLVLENVDEYRYAYVDGMNRNMLIFNPPNQASTTIALGAKHKEVRELTTQFRLGFGRIEYYIQNLQKELNDPSQHEGNLAQIRHQLATLQKDSVQLFDQLTLFRKMLDSSLSVSSSLDLDEVFIRTLEALLGLVRAEKVCLLQVQPTGWHVSLAFTESGEVLPSESLMHPETLLQAVATTRRPALSLADDSQWNAVCLPINLQDGDLYLAYAVRSTEDERFSELLLPILSSFGRQVATAIDNAGQFAKRQEEARLGRDLQIGQEIQRGFLPTRIPQVSGLELAAYFNPARQVAGDFYDVFPINADKLGFVVGDVCDKGFGAALFMGLFRSLLRAFSQQNHALSWMGSLLEGQGGGVEQRRILLSTGASALKGAVMMTNDYIANNHSQANMFATIFFGMIDQQTGVLTYVNGGHNPPYIVSATGEVKAELQRTGPAVGMMAEIDYRLNQVSLDTGDMVLCFTDGLTEAKNSQEEFFGEERLLALLRQHASLDTGRLSALIREEVFAFMGDALPYDDLTYLLIKRM